MNLRWGVAAVPGVPILEEEELTEFAKKNALERGLVQSGDVVVMTAGMKYGTGGTSSIRLHTI